MKKTFKRGKNKHPVHKALLAFDVENDPKTGGFICAGLHGLKANHHQKEFLTEEYIDKQEHLLEWLDSSKSPKDKNIPFKLVAFNLAYDYWFINPICDDSRLLSVGGRIITGKLKNGIPMIDLTNHVDGRLEDWIKYLKMEEKGIYKPDLTDLKERVMMDARATYELGHFLEEFYVNEMGITFKMTVASCARELFQQKFFKHYWTRDNPLIDGLERESYRGGRVEVFKRGERVINGYDVNSMYLSVMHDTLIPDPNSAKLRYKPKELPKEGLYIAKVDVNVPKQHIAPLPYFSEEMNKLIFPTGTFTGVFCSTELEYAIKECGVTVNRIYWVITYQGFPYFKDFAAFVWKKRKEYKAKGNRGMELMIKKIGNSLYGSFGQRNSIMTFYGKLDDFGQIEEGASISVKTINGIEYVSVSSPEKEDSKHTFPCIPSFITANARLVLLKGLKANEDAAAYCDTDSIKLIGIAQGLIVGAELGEWGAEEINETKIFYRAKVYGDKCKGVPKRADRITKDDPKYPSKVREAIKDESKKVFAYDKPNKMRESFRRGLIPNKWEEVLKVVDLVDDKRGWSGEESEPLEVSNGIVVGV